MDPTLELSVYNLVMNSSMFTKLIILILLTISIMSWAIMLNKYLFLQGYKSQITQFVKSLTSQPSLTHLEENCSRFSKGTAKTMPVLLLRLFHIWESGNLKVPPRSIVENAATYEARKLTRGMGILATSANVSPLIGLLGTVWGVMYAFISIGQQGSANIAVVAPGIAEALITTIAGLCVAIPAMAGHNFLTGWINNCLDSLDLLTEYSVSIMNRGE